MNFKEASIKYQSTIDNISKNLYMRNSDLGSRMINGFVSTALWEAIESRIEEHLIPGTVYNKAREFIKQEKGYGGKLEVVFLEKSNLENQPKVRVSKKHKLAEIVDEHMESLNFSDKEIFILATMFGIGISIDMFQSKTYIQYAEKLIEEAICFGPLKWTSAQISIVTGIKPSEVLKIKNQSIKEIKNKLGKKTSDLI